MMMGFTQEGTYRQRQINPDTRMDHFVPIPVSAVSIQPVQEVRMTENGFARVGFTLIRVPEWVLPPDMIPQPGDQIHIPGLGPPLVILRVRDYRRGVSLAHWRLEAD